MKYIRATLVVALVVIAAIAVGVILADHLEYAVEHPESEIDSLYGYENWVMYNWAVENEDVVWEADADIENDVAEAISHWKGAFGELGWATTTNASDVNVKFENDPRCGTVGKLKVQKDASSWLSVGDANYLNKVTICVDSTRQFVNTSSHNGRVATIAHEIGHVYGLEDRYRHGIGCNNFTSRSDPGEVTIMDAVRQAAGATRIEHCDGLDGPATSTDVARVRTLYSKGILPGLTATTTGHKSLSNGKATGVTISWEDAAWAEKEHHIKLFIYESTGWRQFTTESIEDGIGAHRDILGVPANASPKPYELSHDFSPQKFSGTQGNERLPDVADYRFCGTPYFLPFKKEGTQNCSSGSVELVNPRGRLSASASSVSVNGTVTVSLTGLYPNNFAYFRVKVSGPISSSDDCKPADEFLNAASSVSISGCSAGPGTVKLLSRPHAVTIAELTITVESSSQTPTITPLSLLDQYDANMNGRIDADEVLTAVSDYFNNVITKDEVLELVALYFSTL